MIGSNVESNVVCSDENVEGVAETASTGISSAFSQYKRVATIKIYDGYHPTIHNISAFSLFISEFF